jgi:Leucine-rich repeat (LRR) protein
MKKTILTSLFLLATAWASAQIVTIPNAAFKTFLLNYLPAIDTNSDGEIQVSEAQAVTTLDLDSQTNQIGFLTDISGIQSFTNLISFKMSNGFGMGDLDFSPLVHLETLFCTHTMATSINVTGLLHLKKFSCRQGSNFSLIGLNTCTALEDLNCSYSGPLYQLNLSGLANLKYLDCSHTYVHELDISGTVGLLEIDVSQCSMSSITGLENQLNLTKLYCNNNNLTQLNIANLTNLTILACSYNQISNLAVDNLLQLNSLYCATNTISNLNVTNLVNLTILNCRENQISALNTSSLVNLINLDCAKNQISSLDLVNLTNLTYLDVSWNLLTAINVSTLVNLTTFRCAANSISAIDFSNLNNLVDLDCSANPLGSININNLIHLTRLSCGSDQLTSLNVSNSTQLTYFECNYNYLTSIDITNLHLLHFMDFRYNLFTELDFSHITTTGGCYWMDGNTNLQYINFKNSGITDITVNLTGCNNLAFICSDECCVDWMSGQAVLNGLSNVQVSSYCSFVPGGDYNTINGNVVLDLQNNGCDATDIIMPNVKMILNDGTTSGIAFTNNTANYAFYTQSGNFTITPSFPNPYFTISPATTTVNFANNNNNMQNASFCMTPLGIHNDLEITILPASPASPGHNSYYCLFIRNKGNQILSGTVNFYFNDAVLDFVSASPMPLSQPLNNLNWDFSNLLPFEGRYIYITLHVNTPTDTPPVNINDVLTFTATVNQAASSSTPDDTPLDNTMTLSESVIGAFDPNDKTCLEGDTISPDKVGDYLHYMVRFQNTGNAPAQNVVVKDMIDTTKFDIDSFELIASSHPNTTKITGNKVEFIFENINLPAVTIDEPGSHGFVAFKIKTKNNLVLGNSIANKADIYFDFNYPVETNTTNTTVSLLNLQEFEGNSVVMTPIPVSNVLSIKAKETINAIQLYDIQGRLLQSSNNYTNEASLDFSEKATGIYMVKIYTSYGMKTQKVVKK